MAVYVVIKNGEVVNKIIWDGVTPYQPDEGCELVQTDLPIDFKDKYDAEIKKFSRLDKDTQEYKEVTDGRIE